MAGRYQREQRTLGEHYRSKSKEIRDERNGRKAKGLAAFLGGVSGVQLVTKKYHAYQDRKRHRQFLAMREELAADHAHERESMVARHRLQTMEFKRHFRVLGQLERRERKALEVTLTREARVKQRGGSDRLPEIRSVNSDQHQVEPGSLQEEFERSAGEALARTPEFKLSEEFRKASHEEREEEDQGASEGPAPAEEPSEQPSRKRRRRRRRDRGIDRGR